MQRVALRAINGVAEFGGIHAPLAQTRQELAQCPLVVRHQSMRALDPGVVDAVVGWQDVLDVQSRNGAQAIQVTWQRIGFAIGPDTNVGCDALEQLVAREQQFQLGLVQADLGNAVSTKHQHVESMIADVQGLAGFERLDASRHGTGHIALQHPAHHLMRIFRRHPMAAHEVDTVSAVIDADHVRLPRHRHLLLAHQDRSPGALVQPHRQPEVVGVVVRDDDARQASRQRAFQCAQPQGPRRLAIGTRVE